MSRGEGCSLRLQWEKAYTKKLRGELLPYLEPRAHGSQYGGLPARNTEMATHRARTTMLKAKCERQACGALFMDVKNVPEPCPRHGLWRAEFCAVYCEGG